MNEMNDVFEEKLDETLFTLKIGDICYISSPLYGQSYFVCSCFRKLDFKDNVKLLKKSIKSHLRTYNCYEFNDLDSQLELYFNEIQTRRRISAHLVPLPLEDVFELPDSIQEIEGKLCIECNKLQAISTRNRCCKNFKLVKVRMYAQREVKQNATYLLKSINDENQFVEKYLRKAYGVEDLEDQIQQLNDVIDDREITNVELRHTIHKLTTELDNLKNATALSDGDYVGPDLNKVGELMERYCLKKGPNSNELLSNADFIISILNFDKSITKGELLKLHKLPRGTFSSTEKELKSISIKMMQVFNGMVGHARGAIPSRITGIGARTIDANLHHYESVSDRSVAKYNEAAARPLLVYLYRTDPDFTKAIDAVVRQKGKEEYTKLLFKTVLWQLVRILKDHKRLNPLFKFLQSMSIVSTSKVNDNTTTSQEEEEMEDEELAPLQENATSQSLDDITFCQPATLNTTLSALKFFCFGCVLANYNDASPIETYLDHFRDGLIFSQLSTLLYQVQRKQEIRINEHHIELKYDTTTKKYKYLSPDGSVSVTQFRDSYSTVLNKFKAWFNSFLTSFGGDADQLEQFKLLLEDLLDSSKACNKNAFQFSTSNNQPSLKGEGFKLMEAIAKNCLLKLSSEELDLDAIITTVEQYKILCLALVYFASGTNMRQFDVCRLYVSRYNVKQGFLQIGREFGLYMNSSSIKATKTPSTFSLLFDRAQVLLAFGFIVLTQEVSNLFVKKFKKDFRFVNNQDFAKYEKDIVEKIFQQQHEPIYGSYLQERLGNNEVLSLYSELPNDADVLKNTNISAKGKKLKLIFQDIFKNESLSLSQLRQMFSCFNYDLGRLIENLDELDMLPVDLKERVTRLDNDLKRQLDQAQLNAARGDVSGHQEGTRRVRYAGKYPGINALAEDVLQTSQNFDLKSIFFLDQSFIGNSVSNSAQNSQTITTTSVPKDEEDEDIPPFNQSDHNNDPSEYHYENNDVEADAEMNKDSSSYINPELTQSPIQALTNTTTTSTTTSTTSRLGLGKEQIQEEADVLKQKLLDLEQKLVDSENELELSVLCQVCLERRKDTVLLNCGHTFCSICITDIMKNHEENCPQCRQAIHEAAKMFF